MFGGQHLAFVVVDGKGFADTLAVTKQLRATSLGWHVEQDGCLVVVVAHAVSQTAAEAITPKGNVYGLEEVGFASTVWPDDDRAALAKCRFVEFVRAKIV